MRRMRSTITMLWLVALATPAIAFTPVQRSDQFVALVQGKTLTRFGVSLVVGSDGTIQGRAFGRPVTGNWDWSNDGFFCREMSFGQRNIPRNCQRVLVQGTTVRFIADRGAGDQADLQLR